MSKNESSFADEISEGTIIPRSTMVSERSKSDSLVSNHLTSVQSNILLRTGVFAPVGRRFSGKYKVLDLSEDFRSLELCRKEGYDTVVIKGVRLNIETDFKVWCGVVLSFNKFGVKTNKITLKFGEFAKYCGYASKRFDHNLRKQIGDSLGRIRSQTLSFELKGQVKGVHTGLLYKAEYDEFADKVVLMADESLWDLYSMNYQVLDSMKVLARLPRAEVAQCLYLYLLSLPQNPVPVSFGRLRERLQLQATTKEANRRIKEGLQKLESIGLLKGSIVYKNREAYYIIEDRIKSLK